MASKFSRWKKLGLLVLAFLFLEAHHSLRNAFSSDQSASSRFLSPIFKLTTINCDLKSFKKHLKPFCNCSNRILASKIEPDRILIAYENVRYNLSFNELANEIITCDLYNVLRRGKGQKVISYSLYGQDFRYYNHLERILQLAREKYKGYLVRIHYDESINQTLRCELECRYADVVDFCNVNRFSTSLVDQVDGEEAAATTRDLKYMHKMMWRFLPIGDTFVDVFMSRDTDSIFIDREIDSVNVWLASNTYGHIMRDHPQHGTEILGGMWGAHTRLNRALSQLLFAQTIDESMGRRFNPNGNTPKGSDQSFLAAVVYPQIRTNATIHDSYTCKTYRDSKPFPTERKVKDHIGSVWSPGQVTNMAECPLECRPADHQDWTRC